MAEPAVDPWRSASDRRDSARVPVSLLVRDLELGGSFEEHSGNVSLGGAYFEALHPPVGNRFEVRFLLPWRREEIAALA
ncbi:MAG TPA: PilZ domain-containing protein, partial [Anaeromyxobacter sp.]|nr:PilZ domain-containing protein [Anaeromyxobacter sp.]